MKDEIIFIIDAQNDFIEGGALAVQGGTKALDNIGKHLLTTEYGRKIASLDVHNLTNLGFKENWDGPEVNKVIPYQPIPVDLIKSGKIYPKFQYTREQDISNILKQLGFMCWNQHCVKNTAGCNIYEPLQKTLNQLGDVEYVTKGNQDSLDCYSIFHYGTGELRKDINLDLGNYKKFVFAGLATDYCVLETIKSVHQLVPDGEFTLLKDCCAAIRSGLEVTQIYRDLPFKVKMI